MSEKRSFLFSGEPERIDRFLAQKLSPLSRTYIQKLIKETAITVNEKPVSARYILVPGDKIHATIPDFSNLPASTAETVPVLYEDDSLIVVNKPADVVVHPAGPHQENTLIQKLWPKLAPAWAGTLKKTAVNVARPGVVHRLDKGTSGVMVIAKTPTAADNLSRQFAERTVKKIYWALVHGIPSAQKGHIRSVVGRSRKQPHRMSVTEQGRWSETEFAVLHSFPSHGEKGAALVEAHPLTGRTHQIRVQLESLGHPLIGDSVYGDQEDKSVSRPLLHAVSLELKHPVTGKRLSWTAPLPDDFQSFLKKLGWSAAKVKK